LPATAHASPTLTLRDTCRNTSTPAENFPFPPTSGVDADTATVTRVADFGVVVLDDEDDFLYDEAADEEDADDDDCLYDDAAEEE
jgi:hypothetical protein